MKIPVIASCLLLAWMSGLALCPASAADGLSGEQLFAGNCAMCHPHGDNVLAPKKALKGQEFLKRFPKDAMIVSTVRKGVPNTVMSAFTQERLSDRQLADIIAYVRTLTPRPAAGSGKPPSKKTLSGGKTAGVASGSCGRAAPGSAGKTLPAHSQMSR